MTERNQVYQCNVCGNMVEITHIGSGTLVCCEQDMELFSSKSQEEGNEKHLPVVEEADGKLKVKVGSVLHPMEDVHYIEWVELITPERSYMMFLNSGDKPEVEFCFVPTVYTVRAYCNIHGLWKV